MKMNFHGHLSWVWKGFINSGPGPDVIFSDAHRMKELRALRFSCTPYHTVQSDSFSTDDAFSTDDSGLLAWFKQFPQDLI